MAGKSLCFSWYIEYYRKQVLLETGTAVAASLVFAEHDDPDGNFYRVTQ